MKKILAIDDQQDNLTTLKAVIKNNLPDCEVITALTGKTGLQIAESENPDAILLDIIMPEMDGYKVCKALKSNPATKHIPVVMITAIKTDTESRVRGLEYGADAFLSKPIDAVELSAQIKVMFRIRAAEDKLRSEKRLLEEMVLERTAALNESEKKLRDIFENTTNVFYTHTVGHVLTYLSPQIEKLLGYTPEEALVKWTDLISDHPLNKKGFENTERAIETTRPQAPYELELIRKDGKKIWVEVHEAPVVENGKTISIVGSLTEITKRIEAQNQLIEKNQFIETAVNLSPDILYIYDIPQARDIFVNDAVEHILGYTVEEVKEMGDVVSFLMHPEDLDTYVNKTYPEHLKANDNEFLIHEYRMKDKAGNWHWLECREIIYLRQADGSPLQIFGVIHDITKRKAAKEKILKLSVAVEQSPAVIVITDLNGNLDYINPKFTELTGYQSDEALGKSVRILKSGEQTAEFYKELWDTITSGNTWHGEFHNRKKNGDLFWEAASVSPIIDKAGKVTNYIKIAEDITEKKIAAEALKESEAKYRKLIETTSEGFWLFDADAKTLDINKSLCNLLGYSRDEIIGKTPFEFVNEENKAILSTQLSEVNSKSQQTYELCLTTKDNNCIPTLFNATSITDNKGKISGSFAFVTNIRERKRAEKIQKVLYNISNAVMITDNLNTLIGLIQQELGRIIDTTNFYIALYDAQNDTLSLPFFADEKDLIVSIPAGKSLTKYVIDTGTSILVDRTIKKKLVSEAKVELFGSDSKIWLGVPLKVKGEVTGVLAVQSYTDEKAFDEADLKVLEFVSDQVSMSIHRKKSEEDVVNALIKAEESDRLKSAFLANMSHEIRTPMNGIMGFTELLKEPGLSGDDQQNYIDIIQRSGLRMLHTINDLMDISKIEAGQMDVFLSKVDLDELMQEVYTFFRPEAEKKGLELHVYNKLTGDDTFIYSDREKIYSVLSNLVINAIKYTHFGQIDMGCYKQDDKLKIFVNDTGIGIPENRQSAIFDRFVQADIEDKEVYEGSGLGLAISKAFALMLGGELTLTSVPGKGSQFYFDLPYSSDQVETKPVKTEIFGMREKKKMKKLKILIAEDDEITYEYLCIIFEDMSREILHTVDGIETVKCCRENLDIDLILMDIKMPELNGYEATKQIRAFNNEVVILAQTAFALIGDKEKALKAGCNNYISKPIDRGELLDIVGNYFRN